MSNKAIAVTPAGEGFSIVILAEAVRLKAAALAKARPVLAVTNGDEQDAAILAAAVIKGLVAQTEKTRKEVKQPFFDAGKAIDAKAAEYVKELEAEAKRLEGLVSRFQAEEAQKRMAVLREAARVKQEAEEAAQRERDRLAEIESERQLAQAAAERAKSKADKAAAESDLARLRREKQAAELDAQEAAEDAAAASATVVYAATPAATGAAVSFVRDFEVTDIDAFYAFDLARRQAVAERINRPVSVVPAMVRMEVKKNDLKDLISLLAEDSLDTIPGVKVTKIAKAAVRGVSPSLTLQ